MYLASNTRPLIFYAVHQAARYSHGTKNSHEMTVKRVLRYLKGTADKGIIFKPHKSNTIYFHVDSDVAGLFRVEYGLTPICVKSITGYVIKLCDVPIMWVSKMQTQIALSTMEAEYIVISQYIRDLIPIREILKKSCWKSLMRSSSLNVPHTPKQFRRELHPNMKSFLNHKFFEDNMACMKFAQMPKLSSHTTHLYVPLHWYRSKVINLEIVIRSVESFSQLGDKFTKGLGRESFERSIMSLMGW
jgi:hypothetical protein